MERHQAELALQEVERRRLHVPQRAGRQANPPCVQLGERIQKGFWIFAKNYIALIASVGGGGSLTFWCRDLDPWIRTSG
jgi:hypothetical protein